MLAKRQLPELVYDAVNLEARGGLFEVVDKQKSFTCIILDANLRYQPIV